MAKKETGPKDINKPKPKVSVQQTPPSDVTAAINRKIEGDPEKKGDTIVSPSLSPRAKKINEMLEKHPPEKPVLPDTLTAQKTPADKEKEDEQERKARRYRID